jgi:hypothetical protein
MLTKMLPSPRDFLLSVGNGGLLLVGCCFLAVVIGAWFAPILRPASCPESRALRSLHIAAMSGYLRSAQCVRDALCVLGFVLAGLSYEHFLHAYLARSPQVMQLSLAFTGSLGFALWYEFKHRDRRGSLIRMTAITLVFVIAVIAAPHLRQEFFALVAEGKENPYFVEVFTAEGIALLSNPLAGFGGCFGLSVMLARVTCGGLLVRVLSRIVKHDANTHQCPHCHGAIPR